MYPNVIQLETYRQRRLTKPEGHRLRLAAARARRRAARRRQLAWPLSPLEAA